MKLRCEQCDKFFNLKNLIHKYVMSGTKKINYYHCIKCDSKLRNK